MSTFILLAQLSAPDLSAEYNFDMIKMALQFKLGWGLAISTWALALNLSLGLFNNTLKDLAEKQIVPGGIAEKVFSSRWYLLIVYVIDKLGRLKLPTQAKKIVEPSTSTVPKP